MSLLDFTFLRPSLTLSALLGPVDLVGNYKTGKNPRDRRCMGVGTVGDEAVALTLGRPQAGSMLLKGPGQNHISASPRHPSCPYLVWSGKGSFLRQEKGKATSEPIRFKF